ncbi:hypothetical protein [Tessaracoccus sp.]
MTSVPSTRIPWSTRLPVRHLATLVDDVGIVQHACGSAPNLSEGYCVDDAARLVIVATGLLRRDPDDDSAWRMLNRSLAFLIHAAGDVGMHNFMSVDRGWLDEPHVGDHVGRSVWALGELLRTFPDVVSVSVPAVLLLDRLDPAMHRLGSAHEWAYALVGLAHLPQACWTAQREQIARGGVGSLLRGRCDDRRWPWFEERLTYDSARLPTALMEVGPRLGDSGITAEGVRSLEWLWQLCDRGDHVEHVGHLGLGRTADPAAPTGDEQPVDADALVEACLTAWNVTSDVLWRRRATLAYQWFLGSNRLGVPLFDRVSGGCHDGLGVESINNNQGAESTLAFLQAGLTMERTGIAVPKV